MATLIKQKPKLYNKNIFKLESVLDTNIIFYLCYLVGMGTESRNWRFTCLIFQKYWDSRHVPPCLASISDFTITSWDHKLQLAI